MSFAPWLPPDLGLRKTSIGTTSGLGIGLTQNGVFFSVLLLFSPPSGDKVEEVLDGWSVEAMVSWHSCIVVGAFDFLPLYLLGEHFKLDLKLPFLGSFTIHEGGTMTWKDYIRMMIESFRQISIIEVNFYHYQKISDWRFISHIPLHGCLNHRICHFSMHLSIHLCGDSCICTMSKKGQLLKMKNQMPALIGMSLRKIYIFPKIINEINYII